MKRAVEETVILVMPAHCDLQVEFAKSGVRSADNTCRSSYYMYKTAVVSGVGDNRNREGAPIPTAAVAVHGVYYLL